MSATTIAVHSIMIQWNTTVHIIILSLDNLTLYNLVNCQKQSAHQSQLKAPVFVLRYIFREVQHTNIRTDVQYITTLKNIIIREEILRWADNLIMGNNKNTWHCVNFCFLLILVRCTYCTMSFVPLLYDNLCEVIKKFMWTNYKFFLWNAHTMSFVHFHTNTNVMSDQLCTICWTARNNQHAMHLFYATHSGKFSIQISVQMSSS